MKNYQQAKSYDLQKMLEKSDYWAQIHDNKLLCKTQTSKPSKMIDNGTSLILSYYDEHMKYLCTIHRVITQDGKIIHEDIKDVFLDGIRYKAID